MTIEYVEHFNRRLKELVFSEGLTYAIVNNW